MIQSIHFVKALATFLSYSAVFVIGDCYLCIKTKNDKWKLKIISGLHNSLGILGGRTEYIKCNMNCPFIDAIHYNDESSW